AGLYPAQGAERHEPGRGDGTPHQPHGPHQEQCGIPDEHESGLSGAGFSSDGMLSEKRGSRAACHRSAGGWHTPKGLADQDLAGMCATVPPRARVGTPLWEQTYSMIKTEACWRAWLRPRLKWPPFGPAAPHVRLFSDR